MLKKILIGSLIVTSLTSCLKSGALPDPCDYDRCEIKAPATEIQNVQDYITANNITGAVQHCSGLFYVIENPGTGAAPANCSTITVTYEGRLTNGTAFDSPSSAQSFNLSRVIYGWRNGLPELKEGGRIRLYIPPSLGYGNQQVGNIPANSILVFTVNLIDVQ